MSKWFEVQGEVVSRIFNSKGITKNGHEVTTNYIVIKWISEYQGEEYVDYIPIEVKKWKNQADKIYEVREGYFVRAGITYKCFSQDDDIKTKSANMNGVSNRFPALYPKFELKSIEIINDKNNKEIVREANQDFESDVVEDDDLPF